MPRVLATVGLSLALWMPVRGETDGRPSKDRFISNGRRVTYEGRRAGEGYFSPDGRHLIFQSERTEGNPFFQIYILDLETGDSHRVSGGVGKTTCAFFRPETDRVLFASTHLDPEAKAKQEQELTDRAHGRQQRYAWDYDETYDIFSSNRDGSEIKRLTSEAGYDAEGAYSPDGGKIVFCSMRDRPADAELTEEQKAWLARDGAYFGEIYLMNADGSEPRRLTDWPGYDGGPFFSPDGERVIWRHFEPGGLIADVYTMKLDGSDRRRLTNFGGMSWAPYFHPSGRYVIFSADTFGKANFELFIVDAAGVKEPVRVTATEGFDGLPVFSPDGHRIAWTSTRHNPGGRAGQLYLGNWDHAGALAALRSAEPRSPGGKARSARAHEKESPSHPESRPADRAAPTEFSPEITQDDLRAHVTYLASDRMAGRLTGSDQTREAAEYVAERFEACGLKPMGDNGTYFQEFSFTAGVRMKPTGNELVLTFNEQERKLELDKGFRPLSLSINGTFEGPVAFGGYGLVGEGYDSYGEADLTGKCVLVLRYFPEDVPVERRTQLARYAALRVKAMQARERGAKAILFVTGPRSPEPGEMLELSEAGGASTSGIFAAMLSLDVAESLLARAEINLEEIQKALDAEDPHARQVIDIPGVALRLDVALEQQKKSCRNVLALLGPANGGDAAGYVVAGAHYDHLGHGEAGGAFGRKKDEEQIYNGADDNASGTGAILEIAEALADRRGEDRPRGGILFALWSGEELGLIGSEHFVKNPVIPLNRIIAYVNLDMVGRMKDNELMVQGVGSSPDWKRMLERRNIPGGFNLVLQEDPYLPTDSTSFYREGVATLALFTGSHEDYHRPSDDVDKIDYAGLERITRFTKTILGDLSSRPEPLTYAKIERKGTGGGGGVGMRAYTGTEPDYAYEVGDGMRLKGVIGGGPADQAGVKPGDVIVEFGGMEIKNVYEYVHALQVLKPGKDTRIVVRRGDKRIELTIRPTPRK